MEYPRIIAQVPAGEHFDVSAVGEGVWLSVAHLNNLENTMEQFGVTLDERTQAVETANATIGELRDTVSTLKTDMTAANQTVTDQAAMIETLEAQVAELGGEGSGAGTTLSTKEDEQVDKKPVPSYLDENNPINQFADKRLRKK